VISNQKNMSIDRFKAISNKIQCLNLTLDKFKSQLDVQREDPLLASTGRTSKN
jgi:hypothetical protein